MLNKIPSIFLSYSWADIGIADEIDNDFKSIGISFIRDTRDLGYKENMKEFMSRIGTHDFVLLLISKNYLESENCMYEVLELINNKDYRERILPIILPQADIFKPLGRLNYVQYWQNKVENFNSLTSEISPFVEQIGIAESKILYTKILNSIDNFITAISDLKCIPYLELKSQNYKPIIDLIGFDEDKLLDELIKITKIIGEEDQDLEVDRFIDNHPKHHYGLFLRAYIAASQKKYNKAKQYYFDLINRFPNIKEAHNNYAVLLETHFKEFIDAEKHFKRALEINPNFADAHKNYAYYLHINTNNFEKTKYHYVRALKLLHNEPELHNNYGLFLEKAFMDKIGAKLHFEISLELNPNYANAHNNYANLLRNEFNDYEGAKYHFEKSIKLNSKNPKIHINYAHLLKENFNDYESAKIHYLAAIELDPNFIDGHKYYAFLLQHNLYDFEGAVKHYKKVLKLNPHDSIVHNNYAVILNEYFNNIHLTKKHFELAIKIDPTFAEANYNYAILLKEKFKQSVKALKFYQIACDINPLIKTNELDKYFGI